METEIIGWVMRGLIMLSLASVAGLFAWQKKISSDVAVLQSQMKSANASKEDLLNYKLYCAETFVRRNEYVPQMTLACQKLDANANMLSRLDERLEFISKQMEK